MRLLVTGPRNWTDARLVYWGVKLFTQAQAEKGDPVTLLIHGDALGVDRLARAVALGLSIECDPYPAAWGRYSQRPNPAGAIRNRQMLNEGKPDHVLAFHELTLDELRLIKGGSGTADMVQAALLAGLPVTVIRNVGDLTQIGSLQETLA